MKLILQIIDGAHAHGCRTQNGWGKLCALQAEGSGAGAACPGDSGSPLVTWDDDNGGWTLIGILSNGAKSCFSGRPEVYTRVASYLTWIYATMEKYDRLESKRNRFKVSATP